MKTVSYPYPSAPAWAIGKPLARAWTEPAEGEEAEQVVFIVMEPPAPEGAELLGTIIGVEEGAFLVRGA